MQKLLLALLIGGSIGLSVFIISLAPSQPVSPDAPTTTAAVFSSDDRLSHDWGKINIRGGDVEKQFTLTNTESVPLYLDGAVTSCMCTTAVFTLADGSSSGKFGMHGGPDWSAVIQPGESFDVNVIFDPMAHGPTATGPIQRTVNVIAKTDPAESAVSYTRIDVRGDVLSEADYQAL